MTENTPVKKTGISTFSKNYWVVIVMEFFERGSYYGMMSILSVYMTDQLNFTKESVGLIKGTIQPLLYILPILSGAIGDRFGYKRTLIFAFIFLG
ncbi:MAG: MFS transporter, partial [Ignavibacteriaceae bacterium]|nr:MFS transporter [Ignavibacteriaceae bacterium]